MPALPMGRAAKLAATLALLSSLACQAPAPPPASLPIASSTAAIPQAAPPAPSSAPPLASASISPPPAAPPDRDLDAAPLAPPSLVASLAPPQRALVDALSSLCTPSIDVSSAKPRVGCFRCATSIPDDLRPRQVSDESLLHEPYSNIEGAFTAQGAAERALFFDGCNCNGCEHVVHVVARSSDGGHRLVRTDAVMAANDCRVLRRKGARDRAVCSRTFGRQGYVATRLSVYDLARKGEEGRSIEPEVEVVALDNFLLRCSEGSAYVQRALTAFELRDVDRDGDDDLVVDLTVSDGVVTRQLARSCEEGGPTARFPRGRRQRLVYLSTDKGLVPDPATARALGALEAASKRGQPAD